MKSSTRAGTHQIVLREFFCTPVDGPSDRELNPQTRINSPTPGRNSCIPTPNSNGENEHPRIDATRSAHASLGICFVGQPRAHTRDHGRPLALRRPLMWLPRLACGSLVSHVAPSSRYVAPSSRCVAPSSRCLAPSSRYVAPSLCCIPGFPVTGLP